MPSLRSASILLCLAGPLAIAAPLAAQAPAEGAPPDAAAEPPETAPPPETAAPAAPPDAVATPAAAPSAPPPIMVVVATRGRVSDEVEAAVSQSLVDAVTAMAGGRPVHALGAAALRDAITACEDDTCIGAQLAQAGARAGLIARIRGRGRRPLEVAIELRDPVSGAPRLAAIEGELPVDVAQIPAATAALIEPLRAAMPAPPPPPATLLVTVNVDGARVAIDDQEVGTSPVAPVEVAPGSHVVVVSMADYASVRREERIEPGEQARVDVTLQEIGAEAAAAAGDLGWGTSGPAEPAGDDLVDQWWFWTLIGVGAAALIGVAIGIGVAVSDSGGMPMPVQPDPTGIMLPPLTGGM